jgi:hypothetical protein
MDDVPIVDDMVELAAGLPPSTADRHHGRRAQETFEPIIVEMHAQAMANQPGGCGVEHPAQDEAAAGGDRDARLLVIRRSSLRERLETGALDLDALAVARVAAPYHLVNETPVAGKILEVARAARQQRVLDDLLEMAARALDRSILVGNTGIVAGRQGPITFRGSGELRIEDLALSGHNFPNTVVDFGFDDRIDLAKLAFDPGATASYNPTTHILSVTSNGVTDTLTLTSPAGSVFKVFSDGRVGTAVELVPLPQNDDAASIAALSAVKAEGNSGTTSFTFTVSLSQTAVVSHTIGWAVTGSGVHPADASDFGGTLPSGTVTFAPGDTSHTITVGVSGDTVVEPHEGFIATLSNPSAGLTIGAASAAAGTIQNDDTAAVVAAHNDAYIVARDHALTASAADGVLLNDDNAATAGLNAGPAHGNLQFNTDGSFSYTPAAGFTGIDSFSYHAGNGASSAEVQAQLYVVPTEGSGSHLNLFNRGSDAAGLAYWTGRTKASLAAGQFVGSILVNIMSGAQNTADGQDISTLMGKVAVSLDYVHQQELHGTAWNGAADTAAATNLLHGVTSDAGTVLTGIKNAEILIANHA